MLRDLTGRFALRAAMPLLRIAAFGLICGVPGESVLAGQSQVSVNIQKTVKAGSRYSYALIQKNGKDSYSTFSNGRWSWNEIRALRDKTASDGLYVLRGKETFLITDKATLKAVTDALAPVMELGKQQGELGKQQGALGHKQGELGRQQGELGRKMGEVARHRVRSDGSVEANAEKDQATLSRQMEELGHKQEALGKQQGELGKKQEALGHKQEAASALADMKIIAILDAAFTKGLAQSLPASK